MVAWEAMTRKATMTMRTGTRTTMMKKTNLMRMQEASKLGNEELKRMTREHHQRGLSELAFPIY